MPRLIAAICAYNEEEMIADTIHSLLKKVKDVDVIEILDGAWNVGGDSPVSTDRTKEIVKDLANQYSNRCSIVFREPETVYKNEADKRNTQLRIIEDEYGYEPYWVFVIDADERIASATGMFEYWMKDYLGNLPFIGCLTAYARGGKNPMYGPRLFPGGMGVHYHTNRSMIVHNGDHTVEVDYNLASQEKTFGDWTKLQVFHIKDFFIVNLWPIRPMERMKWKEKYCEFQEKVEAPENKPCEWKQKIVVEDI